MKEEDMQADGMEKLKDAFDREPTLEELLDKLQGDRLAAALNALLGAWRIDNLAGERLLGHGLVAAEPARFPIRVSIDTLGYLAADTGAASLAEPAVRLLEQSLRQALLNQMISAVHLAAIQADYEDLQRKHAALTESETRYRELAQQLDTRVHEQVKVIETTQRQLYQAEKLASVGQLAAGVAHEINNPLGFIRSNLATGERYLAMFRQLKKYASRGSDTGLSREWEQADLDFVLEDFASLIKESMNGVDRIASIVKNLKTFSHVDQADVELVDLNDSIRRVADLLKPRTPESVRIVLQLDPVPRIMALPAYLNQVLMNTILNAIEAIAVAGTVTVRTGVEADRIRIDPSIFDPFFTTKEVGQGTGLGLTVSRDIVLAHDGSIDIASTAGSGTVVSIRLPAAPSAGQPAEKRS